MTKRLISVLLTVAMLMLSVPVVYAGADVSLYNIYGDGMLFKQNETAVIAGTAKSGTQITAELYNSQHKLAAKGSVAAADGTFEVSFDAPAGSYEEYSVVLKANGSEFETLENVVFGELWLASGQSNMQYPLGQDKIGSEWLKNNKKLSKRIRVLLVPAMPEYKGSTQLVPCEPQQDIPGAKWTNGENDDFYNVSAVAYFFAASLTEEIDMPVGIINAPLGGSVIASWISREAIESDEQVKSILTAAGEYYASADWVESERSIFYDMTSNYSLKIHALRHFSLSGMIWYQGESDVMLGKTPEQYASLFDLMQESYTDLFGYENGRLPVIYTQLVTYPYHKENGIDLADMNIGFAQMQKEQPDSRAVVTVYDIPISFLAETGSIHPECKAQIGERMALCATGLVYGEDTVYTAATVKNSYIKDGKVYVDFDNTGDGLVCDGSQLRGFAVAGADGVYVQADAVIEDNDTVVVYCEDVEAPVSVTYAYALGNMRANLYSSQNGEKLLPVSSFVTEKMSGTSYWFEKQWADCDDEEVWHIKDDEYTAEYSAWECENAELTFDSDSAFSGENGLHITDSAESFCVSPVLGAKNGLLNVKFSDEGYDYSDYGSIRFNVRNNGSKAVTFDSAHIYVNSVGWYSTADSTTVIPADGEWYTVEVNLNKLKLYGVDLGVPESNKVLGNITDIEFFFSGAGADLSFDNVRFVLENEENSYSPSVNILYFANVFKIIPLFLRSLLECLFA